MTWVPPTSASFKVRYPAFEAVADATIDAVLEEATAEVGETWIERTRSPAIMALTAHLLAAQGIGTGASAGGGGVAVSGAIKRRKVGDVEVEFAGVTSGGSGGSGALAQYRTTLYGQMYLEYMRKNFPAVAVV